MGEEGGATAGALADGIQAMESSDSHHPELLDGHDGKSCTHIILKEKKIQSFPTKISFRFNIFLFFARVFNAKTDFAIDAKIIIRYYLVHKMMRNWIFRNHDIIHGIQQSVIMP